MMNRRSAIKTAALAAGAISLAPTFSRAETGTAITKLSYPYKLPELGYSYDALEPYIDTMTMQIHHDKHHAAYVDNLNKALAGADPKLQQLSLEELLTNLDTLPENIRIAVRNNAGGHYNHSLFWKFLKKNEGGKPTGDLAKAVDTAFESFPDFQKKFTEAATKVFGSGWAWLIVDGKDLEITPTPNQDNPISKKDEKEIPILGIDVWEHSYYLKHQNRRPEYIAAFWNVINWDDVAERYAAAMKG
jgi:superoxide dismutase, Fe-Mn family